MYRGVGARSRFARVPTFFAVSILVAGVAISACTSGGGAGGGGSTDTSSAVAIFCGDFRTIATSVAQAIGGTPGPDLASAIAILRTDAEGFQRAGDSATAKEMLDLASALEAEPTVRTVAVYLSGASHKEMAAIQAALRSLPWAKSVAFESTQQAYERAKATFAGNPDLLKALTPSALPASFRVEVSSQADVAEIQKAVAGMSGVDTVQPIRSFASGETDPQKAFASLADLCPNAISPTPSR